MKPVQNRTCFVCNLFTYLLMLEHTKWNNRTMAKWHGINTKLGTKCTQHLIPLSRLYPSAQRGLPLLCGSFATCLKFMTCRWLTDIDFLFVFNVLVQSPDFAINIFMVDVAKRKKSTYTVRKEATKNIWTAKCMIWKVAKLNLLVGATYLGFA